MNINEVEKLTIFPSKINYYILSIKSSYYMFVFSLFAFLFSFNYYGFMILVYMFTIPFFEHPIDKKIFNSFKIIKEKNDN